MENVTYIVRSFSFMEFSKQRTYFVITSNYYAHAYVSHVTNNMQRN